MKTAKKWKLNPKAVRLLRRVEKHILREPTRYDQTDWIREQPKAPCGTACCIAGWTALLGSHARLTSKILAEERARLTSKILAEERQGSILKLLQRADKALGVNYRQTNNLYCGDGGAWPAPFGDQWERARTNRAKAKIAVARIEHFIKTGE